MDLILFFLSFIIILLGCEFFTNGVEWVGKRFNLAEGAVGSVLAAVAQPFQRPSSRSSLS